VKQLENPPLIDDENLAIRHLAIRHLKNRNFPASHI
jgi:hypothetical protein